MVWRWDEVLKTHPNGMRFSVFDGNGDLLATNEYFRFVEFFVVWFVRKSLKFFVVDLLKLSNRPDLFSLFPLLPPFFSASSVGGGFVVNEKTKGMHYFS